MQTLLKNVFGCYYNSVALPCCSFPLCPVGYPVLCGSHCVVSLVCTCSHFVVTWCLGKTFNIFNVEILFKRMFMLPEQPSISAGDSGWATQETQENSIVTVQLSATQNSSL